MSRERNIEKENAILTGIVAAPLAALVGGPIGALISIGAGIAVGNKKTKDYYENQARIKREIAEESENWRKKQEEDRAREEEYAAEKFERCFQGSGDIQKVSDKLYNYFKDKVDVFDKNIHLSMSLYRPEYYWQENKCQKGEIWDLYTGIKEANCINLNSDNFIQQYELYNSVENTKIKLYMYNAIDCGYTLIMKIKLQNGEIKKFSCLPHSRLKPPKKLYYNENARG